MANSSNVVERYIKMLILEEKLCNFFKNSSRIFTESVTTGSMQGLRFDRLVNLWLGVDKRAISYKVKTLHHVLLLNSGG